MNNIIDIAMAYCEKYANEKKRRMRISKSLHRYNATKKREAGHHRVHLYEYGIYKGYFLLKDAK